MAKYLILATHSPFGEPVDPGTYEYDPQNALIQWFRYSEKYPTCTSLHPETKEDGIALLKWAKLNFEKLEIWAKEHKCPYKTEWLKEQIVSQIYNNKCSMQWGYDELFPFCMG